MTDSKSQKSIYIKVVWINEIVINRLNLVLYKLKIKLPITDLASSNVISLPIHPNVTQKNIEFSMIINDKSI